VGGRDNSYLQYDAEETPPDTLTPQAVKVTIDSEAEEAPDGQKYSMTAG